MKITDSDAPKGVIWYHDTACHKCGTMPVNSWDKRVSRALGTSTSTAKPASPRSTTYRLTIFGVSCRNTMGWCRVLVYE